MSFHTRQKAAYRLAIKDYWHQTLINWKLTFSSFLLTGIGTILVFYIPPLIIGKLVSEYAGSGIPELSELIPYILVFAILWLVGEGLWRIAIYLMVKAETNAVRSLYTNAVKQMMDKDLAFFHENFAGALTTKTKSYATRYVEAMDTITLEVAANILPLAFVSLVLWQYSPWLVVALIGMLALALLIIIPKIKKRRKLVSAREAASNKVAGYVADIYSNVDAVRAYASETFEKDRHRSLVFDLSNKMRRSWDYQNKNIDLVISPLYVLTNVLGLLIALNLARSSDIGIETVFVTFSYYALYTRLMWEFNTIYRRLEASFSEAAQFSELLIDEPTVLDEQNPKPFKVSEGKIQFKNVTFDHEDKDADTEQLFENLNIDINPGEKIGLVGHSGGGKTTLSRLIMRLMDIDSGQILIDGQNIAKTKQSELRKYLSYVPQDPAMFHRTLAENIAYGKKDATQNEIIKAAKMAHAHEFIVKLPDGYQTLVGERGVKLSGGQRQRIAIARAMLKDAPILLLDEATSALDSESEKLIQDALWKLMEGKTAIVIAHRLSTIQRMDRIIVLENGQVVEEGAHKQLLSKKGIYAELWKHQSGGFIEE